MQQLFRLALKMKKQKHKQNFNQTWLEFVELIWDGLNIVFFYRIKVNRDIFNSLSHLLGIQKCRVQYSEEIVVEYKEKDSKENSFQLQTGFYITSEFLLAL